MTVYGPDITKALEAYSSQFDDIEVQERTPIIDLNAINPLSELREEWVNTTTEPSEHHLSTTSGVDEVASLTTDAHGQYTAGYEVQTGIGTRVPEHPTGDGELRWGYYECDTNNEPLNGWYIGVDSTGIFVCEVDAGTEHKVYQENWNIDRANGTDTADENPSGFNLDLSTGHIFQINFTYYGYGPVVISILTDDGKVDLHKFTHDGRTSVDNTNLPIQIEIDNNSTNSDANDLYVGGRQFSLIGQRTTNSRNVQHYRPTLTGVDDTQWHPVISVKLKDGTDIGSTDFRHILAEMGQFSTDTDAVSYRYQIRSGTTPNNPVWETPSSHTATPDETAMKVDTNSTDIGTGSNLTGTYIDGGTLSEGSNNQTVINADSAAGQIVGEQVVTVVVRAAAGGSGTISESTLKWDERW